MKNLTKHSLLISAIALAACGKNAKDLDDGQMHDDVTPHVEAPMPTAHSDGIPKADMMYYNHAQNKAYILEIGKQAFWSNPQTGHEGGITPTREGTNSKGEYCREFQSTHNINITIETTYYTACQTINGTWHVNP